MKLAILIPVYQPGPEFTELVQRLARTPFERIVIINDGSDEGHQAVFSALSSVEKVDVLGHATNLGKGAALKTGFNHVHCTYPRLKGVVTFDADGQHDPDDAVRVGSALLDHPNQLVLGVRDFSGSVPLRSRFGNNVTRVLLRALAGLNLGDTQTGLRGISRDLIPALVRIEHNGYDFELSMLLGAKSSRAALHQVPIKTVYEEGNPSSHFNPILDSMRIYFVLFRFAIISVLTAIIDYAIFIFAFSQGAGIGRSQIAARLVALIFNYAAVRKKVFFSREKLPRTLPRFLLLVLVLGLFSYGMIRLLTATTGISVIGAKAISETMLFLFNFLIQREWIFCSDHDFRETDWDEYYERPYKSAGVTRRITESLIHRLLRKHCDRDFAKVKVVELGGANSCFLDGISAALGPASYHVIDNNRKGLEKLARRVVGRPGVVVHEEDVLTCEKSLNADVCFSAGLIEHFDREGTERCIEAHFEQLQPGGIALITYPTPTWLYRVTRYLAELFHLWIFHDERALRPDEVNPIVERHGEIIYDRINWPVVLTQRVVVARKR